MATKRKRIKETKTRYQAKRTPVPQSSAPTVGGGTTDAPMERERRAMEEAFTRMDRTVFSVSSSFEDPDELPYWLSRTPYERLLAIEMMRRIAYGYDPITTRLQRVFAVVEFTPS